MNSRSWKEMTVPEKIGTLIGYAIVLAMVIMAIVAIISNDMSFVDVVNWLFKFFGTAFGVIVIGLMILLGIIIVFPGLVTLIVVMAVAAVIVLILLILAAIF